MLGMLQRLKLDENQWVILILQSPSEELMFEYPPGLWKFSESKNLWFWAVEEIHN